jgi:MinD-like ATPase involved in chromosome partitioning or flagellar assembly
VSEAVIVISSPRPGAVPIDIAKFNSHFLSRVRAAHGIPFDRHLVEGAEVSLDLMKGTTRQAFMGLAATITDGFGKAVHPSAGRPEFQRPRQA